MLNSDKEDIPFTGRFMKITFMLLVLFNIALIGCKGKAEPPPPDPQPLVQPAPTGEEMVRDESGEYDELPDKGGETESEPADDIVENSPPEIISLRLVPLVIYPGTAVKAEAEGGDIEEDDITFYYRWQKNEEFLSGEESEELDTTGFNKGDLITAFVTPFDGVEEGMQVMSPSLLISNRPPEITSAPIGNVANGVFIYEVEASDPDGDELKYSLEGSPAGMIIDADGRVEWEIPVDAKGPFTVKVVVSDGDATTFQGFNIGGVVIERR